MSSFTIFPRNHMKNTEKTLPVSEITMSTEDDWVQRQHTNINSQSQRIDDMVKMMQEVKEATDTKIELLLKMVSELSTVSNSQEHEEGTSKTTSNTLNKRRP
jgi:hypothetical protein